MSLCSSKAQLTSAQYAFVMVETVATVLCAAVGTRATKPRYLVGSGADAPNEWSKLLAQASGAGAIDVRFASDLEKQSSSLFSAEAEGFARLDEIFAPLEWANLRPSHEVAIRLSSVVCFGSGLQGRELGLNPVDGRVQVQCAVWANPWPCAGYPTL
jgi:hypothetical protein